MPVDLRASYEKLTIFELQWESRVVCDGDNKSSPSGRRPRDEGRGCGGTNTLPKPRLQVRGKPILQHILERLRDAGMTDFLVCRRLAWVRKVASLLSGEPY